MSPFVFLTKIEIRYLAHLISNSRYQTLSVAGSTTHVPGQEAVVQSSGKKVVPDFTQNLGEHAIDLQVITASNGPSQILVLGEVRMEQGFRLG